MHVFFISIFCNSKIIWTTLMTEKLIIENKKNKFDYDWLIEFTAGMELKGLEIKAFRNGNVSLVGAYCVLINNELFLRNLAISHAKGGEIAKRDIKLLLKRQELNKISSKMIDKGLAIVANKIIVGRFAKVGIAVAKGKKTHDKRESIKKKDLSREMARGMV